MMHREEIMAVANDDEDEITGINVTPLVDVMLVLLVIFMVTATYIAHKSIEVRLPKADTGASASSTRNLSFVLDKNARLYLDGKAFDLNNIKNHIEKLRSSGEEENKTLQLQALIAADKETPHGAVVELIDTVRKNAINDFAINVEQQ